MSHRKLAPGKLVIASHNAGKVREIRALLLPYGIEPVSASDLGLPEPAETGTTFAENACRVAHVNASHIGDGVESPRFAFKRDAEVPSARFVISGQKMDYENQ